MSSQILLDPIRPSEVRVKTANRRPATFIVLGKPGAGKSSLALSLSATLNIEYLEVEAIVEAAVRAVAQEEEKSAEPPEGEGEEEVVDEDEESEEEEVYQEPISDDAREARKILLKGRTLPISIVMKLVKRRVESAASAFRGYILSGFPIATKPGETEWSPDAQLNAIKSWSLPPNYLIDLQISDYDLHNRRNGIFVDPITNSLYSQVQILAKDPSPPEDVVDEAGDEEPTEAQRAQAELDAQIKAATPQAFTVPDLAPMDPDVKFRLIKRLQDLDLEDFPALKHYKSTCQLIVEEFIAKFHPEFRLEISAVHAPNVILEQIMHQLSVKNVTRVIKPRILPSLSNPEYPNDADMAAEMVQNDAVAEDKPWLLGDFGVYCPVTLTETRELVKGTSEFQVAYQSAVYAFSTKDNMLKFCQCPSQYLKIKPHAPCRISILTQLISLNTAQQLADKLAVLFNATVLSGSQVADSTNEPQGLKKDWIIVNHLQTLQDLEQMNLNFKPRFFVNLNTDPSSTIVEVAQQLGVSGAEVLDFTQTLSEPDALQKCYDIIATKIDQPIIQVATEATHDLEEIDETEDSGYGDYKHFCPVSLVDGNVLRPGVADLAAKYEGRYYRCATADARAAFIQNPSKYVTSMPPTAPALRVLLIGQSASGKSTQARKLARRLRCFHISFPERLKEVSLTVQDQFSEEIKLYLENPQENPLTTEAAISVVLPFWQQEPYISHGFIMEGFPRSADELRLLLDRNLYADVLLNLTINESNAVKRRFPKLMAAFEKKRAALIADIEARAKARADAKQKRYDTWKAAEDEKRAERLAARKAEAAANPDEAQDDFYDDEPEAEFIDDEEDIVDEPEVEDPEAATERITGEITSTFDEESSSISEVTNEWESEFKLPLVEINGDRREEFVKQSFERAILPYTVYRSNLFFTAHTVSLNDAEELLASNAKQLSSFGTWSPNQVLNGTAVQPTWALRYPAVYRDFVYYFATEKDRSTLFTNSSTLLSQPLPPASVPIRVAVLGAPRSGKSTLVSKLCQFYGCVRVTVGESVRYVLENFPDLELSQQIQSHLWTGDRVPDDFCIDAVKQFISSSQARVNGFVFDGFPATKTQVELLSQRLIIPHDVIHLSLPEDLSLERNVDHSRDSIHLYNHTDAALKINLAKLQETLPAVRAWYASQHRNLTEIDGTFSKWKQFELAKQVIEASVRQQQKYLRDVEVGAAASINGICLTPEELTAHVGHFSTYCPVNWVDNQKLIKSSANSVQFALEYKGLYFYTANQAAFDAFVATPEKYFNGKLPSSVPIRKTASEVKLAFPMQYAFQGFCPVTYVLGNQSYEAIVPGDPNFVAEFEGRLFSFASEERLSLFLESPQLYAYIETPQKVPPRVEPMNVTKLPMLGYMEQTVAAVITKAMTQTGVVKPKFPFLNPSQSAQIYMALYLKAWNPKSSEYAKSIYRKKLRAFEDRCGLVTYLGQTMQPSFSASKPIDLDHKLKSFFALKN